MLDPRCSERTATGTFTCSIEKPNVTQLETPYPSVLFAPGDLVEVNADGCVQTGGKGLTWKRYVNPSGPNSNMLYHGLIRIPSGTKNGGLVTIQSVISNPITVTGAGVSLPELQLSLGYLDNGYSDNGYDKHDNGDGNQCETDPTKNVDGGPAHVTITITRGKGVTPPAPMSRFDFDVLWTQTDPNGLPYQPQWSWQSNPQNGGKVPHIPNTSICHQFSWRPTVVLGIPSPVLQPLFPDCTDQADQTTVDLPQGVNADLCIGSSIVHNTDTFSGHVNWFPITVEGTATGAPSQPSLLSDGDYTFEFISDLKTAPPGVNGAPLSINSEDGLHVEFDSEETVDNFRTAEWTTFREALVGDTAKANLLFKGHTILTGMFGLDGEHGLKAEIHPLYAFATKRSGYESDPWDEAWLMFVRNQGDEGFCSSRIWNAGFQDYTFRLPWLAGKAAVDVNWDKTNFELTPGASGPVVSSLSPVAATPTSPAGVYVTFHLGPPVPRMSTPNGPGATLPFVDGVLHLIWTDPPGSGPIDSATNATASTQKFPAVTAIRRGAEEDEADEVEHQIEAAFAALPAAQQQQIKNTVAGPVSTPVATHPMQPVRQVKRLTFPPAVPNLRKPHAIDGGPATAKQQRDAAHIRALCAASNNAPAGLPAKICVPR